MSGDSEAAGDVWYDNRPCDRIMPREWVVVGIFVAMFGLVGILFLALYLSWGGSTAYAALFAGVYLLPIGFLLALGPLMQQDFAVQVSFRAEELVWRTRSGKTRSTAYSKVDRILPWPARAEVPLRYHVLYQVDRRFPPFAAVLLSPENMARLDKARHRARGP